MTTTGLMLAVTVGLLLPLLLPVEGIGGPTILRGLDGFTPCSYEPDPTNPALNMLTCSEEASAEFSSHLPIIRSDNVGITSISISGGGGNGGGIRNCPRDAFASANALQNTWRLPAEHTGAVQTLTIKETSLVHIQSGCFKGLERLQELRIRNSLGGGVAPNAAAFAKALFSELKRLANLHILQLENIDLSSGIPEHAFGAWSRELRSIRLVRNSLTDIHDDAFIDASNNLTSNAMKIDLRIEKQMYGWKLLRNSHRWARGLHSLKIVSFEGSTMQTPSGTGNVLTVDFGDEVNRKVRTLNLNRCQLTNVVAEARDAATGQGIRLVPLAAHLHRLFLDHNRLEAATTDFLHGLRNMSQLRLLSLQDNHSPLPVLPVWAGLNLPNLKELRLSRSGVAYLPAGRLPASLKRLHLSANPLRQIDPGWASDANGYPVDLTDLHMNYIRLAGVNIGGRQADWASAFQPVAHSLQLLSLTGCQLEPRMLEPQKLEPVTEDTLAEVTREPRSAAVTEPPKESEDTNYIRMGLGQLRQLKTLVLSNNYLTEIPNGAFSELRQLRHLALARNGLSSVETPKPDHGDTHLAVVKSELGRSRQRLQRLDLRGNQLTTLHRCKPALGFQDTLEDLLPLRPVWLAGERQIQLVETVPVGGDRPDGAFREESRAQNTDWLGGLSLTDNPLQCDCRLAWLRVYVDQMDVRIGADQMSGGLPRGYQSYRREALDFVCSSHGIWSSRRFLSLRPIDLYAADHEECRKEPKVFGSALTINTKLEACSAIAADAMAEQPVGEMLAAGYSIMAPKKPPEEYPSQGLSTEAMVMICVAGVATFLFLILCLMVVFWLYFNIKRPAKSLVARRIQPALQSRRNCCTCMLLCSGCKRHGEHPVGKQTGDDNIRKSSESTDVYTLYEEPNSQGNHYADMSKAVDGPQPATRHRVRPTRRACWLSQTRASEGSDTRQSGVPCSSMCSSSSRGEESAYNATRDVCPTRQPLLPWQDPRLHPLRESGNIGGSAVIPPPMMRAPLPPVPAPRKTRSTVDLLTSYVEDIAAKKRRLGVVDRTSNVMRDFPVPSPRQFVPPDVRRRHHSEGPPGYRRIVLEIRGDQPISSSDLANIRRAISDPANINEHLVGAYRHHPLDEDTFGGVRRPIPLPVSSHRTRKHTWLQSSRQIIRRGIDKLTCIALSTGRGKRTEERQQRAEAQPVREEYKPHLQGPRLPRPVFYTPTDRPVGIARRETKSTGDYLSMDAELRSPYQEAQTQRPHTDYVKDEYVIGLMPQPVGNESAVRYHRLPSLQRKPLLQLDKNLYTLTQNGAGKSELTHPDPPPPPPPGDYHNMLAASLFTPSSADQVLPNRPLPVRMSCPGQTKPDENISDILETEETKNQVGVPPVAPKVTHLASTGQNRAQII